VQQSCKNLFDQLDAAWAEIADGVGTDPLVIEAARLKLANALLSVASEDSRDVEALKRAALEATSRMSRP